MNKRTKQDGTAFSCECGSFFNQKCNFYRHRKTCLRVLNHGVNSANDEMNELRKELTNMREEMQKIKNAPSSSTTTILLSNFATLSPCTTFRMQI
jgi:hypothetical protein